MIEMKYLKGSFWERKRDYCVFMTDGGVAYKIFWSRNALFHYYNYSPSCIDVCNVISDGDEQLFGFNDNLERDIFKVIVEIEGIKPKFALNIVSSFTTDEFIDIVENDNIKLLTKVKGINLKKAEEIYLKIKSILLVDNEKYRDKISDKFIKFKKILIDFGLEEKRVNYICNSLFKNQNTYTLSFKDLLRLTVIMYMPPRHTKANLIILDNYYQNKCMSITKLLDHKDK